MANPNNLFGFRPLNRDSGAPFFTRLFGKAATDNKAIFMNDLVLKTATSIPSPTAGPPLPGITSGQNGTPGTSLWLGTSINFGAASQATSHYVVDSLDTTFIAQVDGSLAVTNAAHAGKNANVVLGTGNAATKQSTMGVANGSIAVTAGLDLRVLRVCAISPNAEGANAIVEVTILKSASAQGSAGV